MTEHEIASAIENYVTSHEGVTNFPVAIEQIKHEVDTLRIRLFDDADLQLRHIISLEPYLQTIKTKETERDGKNTIVKVPDIHIRENGKVAIDYCGSSSGNTPYRIVTGKQNLYATYDQFIGNAPLAHYQDGVITFYNSTLKNVTIRALFSKPSDLAKYGYEDGSDESKTGTRYPIPKGQIDVIIGKTAESYIRVLYRSRPQPNRQVDLPNAGSQV